MTDIENHMVIGNEVSDMDEIACLVRVKRKQEMDLVNTAAERLLSGGKILGNSYIKDDLGNRKYFDFDFNDVITRAWEDDSFPDCAKEILELYPDSKLAKLIKHMAVVVAADALDIEV